MEFYTEYIDNQKQNLFREIRPKNQTNDFSAIFQP